jgi:transposase
MGQIFHPYEPDQSQLFPPSPRDWMPEGHLAYFISETVDQLDLKAFYARFRERKNDRGSLAYEPRMLLKVLIYSYSVGVFSSRKIAAGIDDLVALRYLSAGNQPGHRTMARFRHDNAEHFADVFRQVVKVAQEAGLVGLGTLAIDGSRLKANASKHKAMSYVRMKAEDKRLEKEIKAIVDQAEGIDAAEDAQFGPDFRGDELPKELQTREGRKKKIREAIEALKKEQAEKDEASKRGQGRRKKMKRPNGTPPDHAQHNFTDPESRIMKTSSGGYEQCFNAQIGVDASEQIIVSSGVTQSAADVGQLLPTLDRAEETTGRKPKHLLADGGYKSEANFLELEERGVKAYISLGRKEETREKAQTAGPATKRMHRKLNSKQGRKRYKARKQVVEPAFGWIKHVLGFRGFSMRGLNLVRAEWDLVCLCTNLRRMNRQMAWI